MEESWIGKNFPICSTPSMVVLFGCDAAVSGTQHIWLDGLVAAGVAEK
jgi:hypothetical protein